MELLAGEQVVGFQAGSGGDVGDAIDNGDGAGVGADGLEECGVIWIGDFDELQTGRACGDGGDVETRIDGEGSCVAR